MWAPSTSASVVDHELVVAGVLDVELLVDAGADRRDQRLDLVVGQHLVDPALLDVDDLAAQRQHRLGVAIAGLLGRAAGRVALDDEELGQAGSLTRAVGELARQGRVLERRLAAGQVAGLAGRVAGAGGVDRLADDPAGVAGVLLEELAELAVDGLLDQALDRRVAELGLRLALELRVVELHRDHRGQALADVVAASGSRPSPSAAPSRARRRSGSGSAPSGSRRGASRPRGC